MKKNFDKKVRSVRLVKVGDFVFKCKDRKKKGERIHKLSPKALGPFVATRVFENDTLEIWDRKRAERINRDRNEVCTPSAVENKQLSGSIRNIFAQDEDSNSNPQSEKNTGAEYVVEKLCAAGEKRIPGRSMSIL